MLHSRANDVFPLIQENIFTALPIVKQRKLSDILLSGWGLFSRARMYCLNNRAHSYQEFKLIICLCVLY